MEQLVASYRLGEQLGKGHYATVHSVVRISDGAEFAAKVIDKGKLSAQELQDVAKEVKVLKEVAGHRHIAEFVEHFESEKHLVIVLELVRGGELFQQIVKQRHYSEADAQVVTRNLLLGLQHVHARRYVHRDLKPENILLAPPPDDPNITDVKISDFGFAEEYVPPGLVKCCGTPLYIAPEVLKAGLFRTGEPYGMGADMWSLGVIAYILLCGYPPFRGKSTNEQFKAIVRGVYSFPPNKVWGVISDDAKDFISKLLVMEPEYRLDANAALEHPWIRGAASQEHLGETVTNLIDFNAQQQWRKGIFGVEAITRLRYAAACRHLSIRPNSELEKLFADATSECMTEIDLSRNYLGPKGLMALLQMVAEKPTLERVVLQSNGVTNAVIELLCKVLRSHPRVCSVDLSDNPISHIAGRHLLHLVQSNTNITAMNLDGTALMPATTAKIAAQVERNIALKKQAGQ